MVLTHTNAPTAPAALGPEASRLARGRGANLIALRVNLVTGAILDAAGRTVGRATDLGRVTLRQIAGEPTLARIVSATSNENRAVGNAAPTGGPDGVLHLIPCYGGCTQ